jgi:hypothetical protein
MDAITVETRREGLEHIEPKAAEIATVVLAALIHQFPQGATAGEISKFTGVSLNNTRSRLTELYGRQRVITTGKKLNPETGVRVAVWAVVP